MKQGVGPLGSDTRFYMDDSLEISNATNDAAPEELGNS